MTGWSSVQPQAAAGDAAPAAGEVLFLRCEPQAGLMQVNEWVRRIHADMKASFACPEIVKRGGN